MNEHKLNRILEAARTEPVPEASPDFQARVRRRLRGESALKPLSLSEQLSALFPKMAWAAAIVIGVCLAGDALLVGSGQPGISEGAAEVAAQWLLPAGGI